jgi:hypothetical protein
MIKSLMETEILSCCSRIKSCLTEFSAPAAAAAAVAIVGPELV